MATQEATNRLTRIIGIQHEARMMLRRRMDPSIGAEFAAINMEAGAMREQLAEPSAFSPLLLDEMIRELQARLLHRTDWLDEHGPDAKFLG